MGILRNAHKGKAYNNTPGTRLFLGAFQAEAKRRGITYSKIPNHENPSGMRAKSAINYVGGENNLQSIINKVWGKDR